MNRAVRVLGVWVCVAAGVESGRAGAQGVLPPDEVLPPPIVVEMPHTPPSAYPAAPAVPAVAPPYVPPPPQFAPASAATPLAPPVILPARWTESAGASPVAPPAGSTVPGWPTGSAAPTVSGAPPGWMAGPTPASSGGTPSTGGGASPGPGAGPGSEGPTPSSAADVPLAAKWKHQLFFESDDKAFSLFLGGRVQFDTANYAAPAGLRANVPGTLPLEDGVTFRRMRLQAGGTIYETTDFLLEVDFFNAFVTEPGMTGAAARAVAVTVPTDAWFTFREVPFVGNIRVGNHKPPISFEHLTSSRFLNFMERSLGFDAFIENGNNGFEPGVSAFDTYAGKRGTWAVGAFKNTRTPFAYNVGRSEVQMTGRVTYLPVYEADGERLVHVGLGASHRDTDDHQVRYRSRLDVRNSPGGVSPILADTGAFAAGRQQILVPEFVVVSGPLSFQSEYYASWAQGTVERPGTAFFQSFYAEAHYFLTGEHRAYNRDTGAFGRVVPRNRLRWGKDCGFDGWGAWQVAARYSYLDLNSRGIEGGIIHDMTLGLNWFFNPNAKLQLNYSLADRDVTGIAGDGVIHGFGTRLAWDF